MDKKVNLNVELDSNGSYVRRNNLPVINNIKKTQKIEQIEQNEIEQSTKSFQIEQKFMQNVKTADISESIVTNKEEVNVPKEVKESENENQRIIDEINSRVLIKDISPNEFYINGKHIIINKWKVKTRSDLLKCSTFTERRKVLVYDNLKEFVPLDLEEFNYVLYRIRDYSFNAPIKYNLTCNSCGKEYSVAYNLKDLYRPFNGFDKDVEFTHLNNGKLVKIVFTNLMDKNFADYEKLVTDESDEYRVLLTDFIYHIKSINGAEIMDYNKLLTEIEQWDADVFEKFFNDYNSIKFYLNTENTVKCPHCLKTEVMNFDEFPNFYPDSWSL